MSEQTVAAMILAAGASERYGQPLITHIARAVLASPARPVIVVLGVHADEIHPASAHQQIC